MAKKSYKQPKKEKNSPKEQLPTFFTEQNIIVRLDLRLNDGGQGVIFRLHNSSGLKDAHAKAAKLFNEPASAALEQKLRTLMEYAAKHDADTVGICFPQALLYKQADKRGGCVGFVMNYQQASEMRNTVCMPKVVRDYWKWSRRDLCRFAVAMLKRFATLHKGGLLMGDVNDRNVLASAGNPDEVYFVDVDSYQIGDFPSGVHTTEFDPPRLMDCQDFEHVMRTLEDEYYSISALLFKIFLVGLEPFSNGGVGTLEQNRRQRRFMFPIGYDSPDQIRGPWQRIWYNLPLNIRQAFYDTFHNKQAISPAAWMRYIGEYYSSIQSGRYPDVILIPRTERADSIFLGMSSPLPDVEKNDALRQFSNWLNPDNPVDNGRTAYLEFGAASFRVYEPRTGTSINLQHIRTGHFDFISPQGEMDVKRLYEALTQPEAWPFWQRYLRGVLPTFGQLVVFGCAGLRHLRNREEVVQMMHQKMGLHVGIVSQREEAELMVDAAQRQLGLSKNLLIVDTGGMASTFVERHSIMSPKSIEIPKLGSKVMLNGLFATTQPDSRLQTKLEEHDHMVSNAIITISLVKAAAKQRTALKLATMGIMGKLAEFTGIAPKKDGFTCQQLTEACRMLSDELLTNRTKAVFLKQDILELGIGDILTQKTELRLCLPIYIELMKILDIDRLQLITGGVGKSYVDNHERNRK